jgi:tetratricopeptide (TPR) repeat protein
MADAKAIGFLELNIKGFEEAIGAAKRALAAFGVALSAYKGIQFFKDGVKDAISFGNSIYFAAQQMGKMDVDKFFLVQKALENIGYSAEGARSTMQEFILAGRPLKEIFGSGQQYGLALQNAANQYGKQAQILKESAAVFSKVFETMQAVAGKVREFFLGMTQQFLKPLQALLETIQRIDLASIGAEFGRHISDAINILNGALSNNTFGKMVELSFKIGALYIKQAFENVGTVLGDVAEALGGVIIAAITSINWSSIATLFGASLFKAIYNVFEAGAKLIVKALATGISLVPGLSVSQTAVDKTLEEIGTYFEDARKGVDEVAKDTAGPLFDSSLKENAQAAAQVVLNNVGNILNTLSDSPELQAAKAQLGELAGAAKKSGEAIAASTPDKLAAFTYGTGDPARAIADSLARVGGGGNSIISGQNIQEKQLFIQERTLQATIETNNLLRNFTPASPITMGSASVGNQ